MRAPDGASLCADVYGTRGERCPVLCIPGLTRNARDFAPLADRLGRDRLVVAVDLRGRGRSAYDPTAASYRLDVYAADVLAWADELSLDRVALVGTSLGGLVATHVGMTAPGRVAGIVLNDVGPELAPEGAERIAAYAGEPVAVETWAEAIAQTRLVSEVALPGLSDEEWAEEARRRYDPAPDGRLVPAYDPGVVRGPGSGVDPWWAFHAVASIPVLLVRGAISDLLAPETVEAMRAVHPDLEVVEVPGRGHAPLLHETLARDAVERFLHRLDAPGAGP